MDFLVILESHRKVLEFQGGTIIGFWLSFEIVTSQAVLGNMAWNGDYFVARSPLY